MIDFISGVWEELENWDRNSGDAAGSLLEPLSLAERRRCLTVREEEGVGDLRTGLDK